MMTKYCMPKHCDEAIVFSQAPDVLLKNPYCFYTVPPQPLYLSRYEFLRLLHQICDIINQPCVSIVAETCRSEFFWTVK